MNAALEWDTEAWRRVRDEKLMGWMLGNVAAVNTVIAISAIAETWDDLYDGDNSPDRARISEAFTLALIKLQVNDFFKANESLFFALMVTAINAWMDANEMQESEDRHQRMMAWFLRSIGHEIANLAAFRVGGWEHMRKVSLEMRLFFQHETFEQLEARHA